MKAKYLMLGGLALAMAAPLSAAPVFNFNSIALSANTTDGLNGFADSTAIKNYMNSVAGCSPGCVSSVTGAMATANYNADGAGYKFPSGPLSGQYMTLGTTDGATSFSNIASADAYSPDVFIMNNDIFAGSSSINITFSSNLPIGTVVAYDWQIFADSSCAPCTSNFPDLEFFAGGVLQQTHVASSPGAGYFPQGMGHDSITLTAATNYLQWFDWPPEVGMDYLSIVPPPLKTVPEPSPLPLAGLALALLALVRWKARRGPALTRLN
jgi:hypothetical protein